VPAPSGLIAWWPGDGHANDIVGTNHGVAVNGAGYATGLIGQAFRLNGTNQYFSIRHSPSLSFTKGQPYTLEAWVYRTGGALPLHVLGKRDSDYGCYYQMGFDYSTPIVPLNKWTHLVDAHDGTNSLHYHDGVLVLSGTEGCPGPNSADFQIGSSHNSAHLQGMLDDVRVYNRALTASEIKAIHDAGANGMCRPPSGNPFASATPRTNTRPGERAPATNTLARPGCVPPPPGLIAWWPGDGHASDVVGNLHGVPVNGADYGPGLMGRAFRVNGSNQYFSIPHTPSLAFTNGEPYTLEAWVYRTQNRLPFHIMGKRDPDDPNEYQMGYDGSGPDVPLRKWTHLVDTVQDDIIRRYKNGVFDHGSVFEVKKGPNTADFRIGYSGPYGGFVGLIDDVRIYNRALAPPEIKAIFDSGSNGMCLPTANGWQTNNLGNPAALLSSAGLTAWWPGDGDAKDYAGIHNGTLLNGTAFGAGKVGQAFMLNGYSAYVQVPAGPHWSFGSNSFTIQLWAKFAGASGGQTLVACDEGGGDLNKWILWFNHGGIGLHGNNVNLGGFDIGYSSFVPTLHHWYHLAVTRRSTQFVFFINGTAVSINPDRHAMPSPNAPLTIGAAEGGNFFNGSIDEVRIYDRALSPSEIAAIYASENKGTRLASIRGSSTMRQTNTVK
jgi:hypothetical protein